MSDTTIAALAIFGVVVGIVTPGVIQRLRRRRRLARRRHEAADTQREILLARVTADRDYWRDRSDKWHAEANRLAAHAASLIEVIEDHHEAAAAEAMVQNPEYFNTAAGRALAELDERTWGQS